jgi:hypothetical protein
MRTVTGAAIVFSTFKGINVGFSRAFASGVVRKRNLAGEAFALVGPKRAKS